MVIEVVASDLENDRDRRGCRLGRQRSGIPDGDEQCDRPPSQFGGQHRQPIHLTIGPSINDRHVLALDKSGFLQGLAKCA